MPLDRKKIALVHLAATRLGMDEDTRRNILLRCAGVSSSSELDAAGFRAVMDCFARLGFQSDRRKAASFGSAEGREMQGMATPGQVGLMRELWSEVTDGQGTDDSLGKWLEKRFKVSALRFVDGRVANKAIAGLLAWKRRKNPPSSGVPG